MADSNFRGPLNAMGSLEVEAGTAASIQPLDGPSGVYQGLAFFDPRNVPFPKDGLLPGRVPGFLFNNSCITVDAIPQAAGTTLLAAAQTATALGPLTLISVALTNYSANAASIAVGVPLIPQGTTVVQSVIALDFGFTTGTTTANSSTLTVPDSTQFQQGQWIVVGNVGNAAGTVSLISQVQTVVSSTSIQILPAPATALGVPIGGANLWGSGLLPPAANFGPSAPTATGVSKTFVAGLQRIHNPRENLARNLSVTASASTAGTGTFLITGYDVWGNPMTEKLASVGVTTVFGQKGWKYISSVVCQNAGTTGTSANYSLGIGDVFSFPFRVDYAQELEVWAGNTTVTNNVGFLAAATTSPATNTTGDTRGTLQLSGLGTGTVISAPATTNNVLRLFVVQNTNPYALCSTTPNNTVPLFGVAQSTT